MKKMCIILPLLMGVLSFCHAQTSGYKMVDVQLDGNKMSQAAADVANVKLGFCEQPDEKTVSYTIASGKAKKLCYVLSNLSDQDLDVHVSFVDGTLTNDQRKNDACKQEGDTSEFGQYVTGYESVVHLPARGEIQRFATINFPQTFTGSHKGCLTYYLGGTKMGGGVNFTVLMRKAEFIHVNIVPNQSSTHEGGIQNKDHFLWMLLALIIMGRVIVKKISIKKTTRK